MAGWLRDMRLAGRRVRRQPGFSIIAIVLLGVGIGANCTIFSVLNGVVLRPVPFEEPDSLVFIDEEYEKFGWHGIAVSPADYLDFKEQSGEFFEHMVAFRPLINLTVAGRGEPQVAGGIQATADIFQLLGISPVKGRPFHSDEEGVLLLSYDFWKSYFGGTPDVVGDSLVVDGKSYTVIGVMPARLHLAHARAQIWIPLDANSLPRSFRSGRFLRVLARLAPDATLESAQRSLSLVANRLATEYPATNTGVGVKVVRLHDVLVGDSRRALLLLQAGALFILLMSCANLAYLFVLHGLDRDRENAVQLALGAPRHRLVRRQLFFHSALIGAGGCLGLVLSRWSLDFVVSLAPYQLPRLDEVTIDWKVVGFAMALSIAAVLAAGLLPALRASLSDPGRSLKQLGWRSDRFMPRTLEGSLVAVEVSLSVVVLVGAGLLTHSFVKLSATEPGFEPDGILLAEIPLTSHRSAQKPAEIENLWKQFSERAGALPGVQAVAVAYNAPFVSGDVTTEFEVEGRPSSRAAEKPQAYERLVGPGYFGAMKIPLLAGRVFSRSDTSDASAVAVVNQALSNRFWPDRHAQGHRIRIGSSSFTIVGVVGDVKRDGLDAQMQPAIYRNFLQHPFRPVNLLILRTAADPTVLAPLLRSLVHEVDPDQPILRILTMEKAISDSVAVPRFNSLVLSVFAFSSLVLAAFGTYGAIAHSVNRRMREIGVRMALGADRRTILAMMLKRGMLIILLGTALGLAGAFLLTRLLAGLLYGITPENPPTYLLAGALVLAVGGLACYIPSQRAARLDPMAVLRCE